MSARILPKKWTSFVVTIKKNLLDDFEKVIKLKRKKELWKFSECNRGTEVVIAITRYIEYETARLEKIETPKPLERERDS